VNTNQIELQNLNRGDDVDTSIYIDESAGLSINNILDILNKSYTDNAVDNKHDEDSDENVSRLDNGITPVLDTILMAKKSQGGKETYCYHYCLQNCAAFHHQIYYHYCHQTFPLP
jgi:hypothetical protein